jgi:hypothetical protein
MSSVLGSAWSVRPLEHDRGTFLKVDCPSVRFDLACLGSHGPGFGILRRSKLRYLLEASSWSCCGGSGVSITRNDLRVLCRRKYFELYQNVAFGRLATEWTAVSPAGKRAAAGQPGKGEVS